VRFGLGCLAVAPLAGQEVPRAGLVITQSVRLRPGTYRLPAPGSRDSSVIVVRGDGVTVDARGVTLLGAGDSDPDEYAGVAIRIDGGHGVRIVGARIHGYRFGVIARGTRGLVLDGLDVSRTWKPRLFSLPEHESLVDWLSFHHNEHDEWLRYGAGIYLEDVDSGDVKNVTGEQGMNGLMLVRSDHLRIWDDDFSFNSGLGIGLYRSSENDIQHNRLDYDIRGYSHKFYHRGQDSAGLLLFEQSSRNIIAYNSVTHGGDGLFLWAGQSTMDSGTGGCNDNLIYGNNFSYAAANGIEVTFSRNTIVGNHVDGNDYGVWGGYSYGTRIIGNDIQGNRSGIAIEHGQDNEIAHNYFFEDSTAISLWADSVAPSDWGYPKYRDIRSRRYTVTDNLFSAARVAVRLSATEAARIESNYWSQVDSTLVARDTAGIALSANAVAATSQSFSPVAALDQMRPAPLGGAAVPLTDLALRGRDAVIIDEWGPYDWLIPKLWPVDKDPTHLVILGPTGNWHLLSDRGVATVSRDAGRVGDTVMVRPRGDSQGDWTLTFELTTSPHTEFAYDHFEPAVAWDARFFVWSDSTDPRSKPEAFQTLLHSAPILSRREPRLDYEWYAPAIKALPLERWALDATGAVDLGPGTYSIRTISDDAVRVWVDGRIVIDDWTPHESAVDHAVITGGHHTLEVQYYQVDGWTELRLDIVRGVETSIGSPGPH